MTLPCNDLGSNSDFSIYVPEFIILFIKKMCRKRNSQKIGMRQKKKIYKKGNGYNFIYKKKL